MTATKSSFFKAPSLGTIVFVITTLGAAFGAGVFKGEDMADKKYAAAAVASANMKIATVVNAANQNTKVLAQNSIENLKIGSQVTQLHDQLEEKKLTLSEALHDQPKAPPVCDVNAGVIRLLDDAGNPSANPGHYAGSGSTLTAFGADGQKQAFTPIGEDDLLQSDLAVRVQYTELATVHDKLVDWVQQHIVDPVATQSKASQTNTQQ